VMKSWSPSYKGNVRVVYTTLLIHAPARLAHPGDCAAAKAGASTRVQGRVLVTRASGLTRLGLEGTSPRRRTDLLDAPPTPPPPFEGEREDRILKIEGRRIELGGLKADMASPECSARIRERTWRSSRVPACHSRRSSSTARPSPGLPKDELFKADDHEQLKIAEDPGVGGGRRLLPEGRVGKGGEGSRSKATQVGTRGC